MNFDSRKERKQSNKQKAEAQFDCNAAPVSLKSFFNDLLEPSPAEIDLTQRISGFEEVAPIVLNNPIYPENSEELAPQLLDLADNFLHLSEKLSNEQPKADNHPLDLNEQLVELTTLSMIQDTKQETVNLRIKHKNLSAKRFAFKALQLFSFNHNYGKHFTMDQHELRKLNPDMLIDITEESVQWLMELGNYYKTSFLSNLDFSELDKEDSFLLNNLQNTTHFKALGFSVILKNCNFQQLVNPFVPLGQLNPMFLETGYRNFTFKNVLDYFQIRIFGVDKGLDFQLNYLHLIPYYLRNDKKKKIFTLFEDLDFKMINFDKQKINFSGHMQ